MSTIAVIVCWTERGRKKKASPKKGKKGSKKKWIWCQSDDKYAEAYWSVVMLEQCPLHADCVLTLSNAVCRSFDVVQSVT